MLPSSEIFPVRVLYSNSDIMLFYVISGIYCLIYESKYVLGTECNVKEMNECITALHYYEEKIFPNYGETEKDLDETCMKMNATLTCPSDFDFCEYDDTCDSVDCQMALKAVQSVTEFSGVSALHEKLCEEKSSFRENYLTHSSCLKKTTASYEKCYKTAVSSYSYLIEEDLISRETICCFHTWLIGCYTNETSTECGQDSVDFVKQALGIIKHQFESLCRDKHQCDRPPLPDSTVDEKNDIKSTEDYLPATIAHHGNDKQVNGQDSFVSHSSEILVIAFLTFIFSSG